MEDSTYKIIQIAGTSPDGVTEAMRSGVKRASETLRNLDWVEVTSIRGHLEGSEVKQLPGRDEDRLPPRRPVTS